MAKDLLLNMDITLNRLFKYAYDKYGPEKAAEVFKSLKKLQEKHRILELIPYKSLSTSKAIEALDVCCEWLTKKDKTHTYFFQLDECEMYDVFYLNFPKKNPTFLERIQAGKTFINTIEILGEAGYFEKNKRNAYSWNCLYYYDKTGFLWLREIPEFLDILFKSKLKPEYMLIVSLN